MIDILWDYDPARLPAPRLCRKDNKREAHEEHTYKLVGRFGPYICHGIAEASVKVKG